MKNNNIRIRIETPEGTARDLEAKTAILFMIDDTEPFLKKKADHIDAVCGYVGEGIPNQLFVKTIGNMICDFVEKGHDGDSTVAAAYHLLKIAELLMNRSDELTEQYQNEACSSDIGRQMKSILLELIRKERGNE